MFRMLLVVAAVLARPSGFAAPVTADRINTLPAAERAAWISYLERSQSNALADAAAIQAEVVDNKMTNALRAPDGGDFRLPAEAGASWYAGPAASNLTTVVLSYQTPSGGWSKHNGYSKGPRQRGMQFTSQNAPGKPAHYVATFDNRATTEELHFLANVWLATKRADCSAAFRKGLDFILAAQFPNGGWPQVYPLEGGYHDDITFNDDAMTRILELLHAITLGEARFAFLDESARQRAAAAFKAGLHCVLSTQVHQQEKLTVWCAQHDALTLQPAPARKMEPATLSGMESAGILKFLMSITNPAPELVTAIESGLAWLEHSKVPGLRRTRLDGRNTFISDPSSTQIYWARFYNLTNNQPVFPGRDGVTYDTFAAMAAKNPTAYDYLSAQPGSLLTNGQKQWRKMLATESAK